MAEGDNQINKRTTPNKAKPPTQGDFQNSKNGRFEEDAFKEDVFKDKGFEEEGFRQEGGTTHGTRRHRAQTLIIIGVLVLGVMGLGLSFLLRDEATPAPRSVIPGATLFVTVGPTRTPRPPASPQPAPTFAPISIQRATTPRQALREIKLADGLVGTNTRGKNTGLYSYDGRWLATLNDTGTELQLRGGQDGASTQLALPELADANPQIYSWAPDNTALLLTAGLSSTQTSARQLVLVRWDAADKTLSRTHIPITTTLDALTLGRTDPDTDDDLARTALAYWSPDGSHLAVIADAVLDDPPYNEDGSPRFRKLVRLFNRAGNALSQFETASDCCYWTPSNELVWWDARDPNAREYVFHRWSEAQPITDAVKNGVRISTPYSPSGLWIVGSGPYENEHNQVNQLLVVELGEERRLVRVDFDNGAVVPLLDRLEKVSASFTSPDVPVTALRFTRVGADNTLWFYDWSMAEMVAGGPVQQLGSWDARMRGFTSVTFGSSAETAQIEIMDPPTQNLIIDYASAPQPLRVETSMLRPWIVNSTGIGAPSSSHINANLVSPDGQWHLQLNRTANMSQSQMLPDWPADLWKILPANAPIMELVMTALDTPSRTFTRVFTLADGIPAFWQWSPASTAIAITTLNSTSKPQSTFVVQLPGLEDEPSALNRFDLADQTISPAPPIPIWSQDGDTVLISSGEDWHILDANGVEKQQFAREPGDSFLLHLSNQLLLLTQSNTLQAINLRNANITRQTVYTWTTQMLPHGILGISPNGSEAIIFEADPSDNTKTAIQRISFETGAATLLLQFDEQPQYQPFAAGPSSGPVLGISLHVGGRVLDQHIWFYDWDTSTLYDYDRPAKLLGWDAASKSFLLARRSADGFQVEAMQPLIQ